MSAKLSSLLTTKIYTIPHSLDKSHYNSLDGFRAIAILIVLIGHCVYNNSALGAYHALNYFVELAHTGVVCFFVLSGFLITTLLLKEYVSKGDISLRNFYIRRALRILPVAYGFIVVLILLNTFFNLHIHYINFLFAFTFLLNFLKYDPRLNWNVAHYWSLSVEEQYYLFFPWIIKYLNRHLLTIVILILLVCIGLHSFFDPTKEETVQLFLALSNDIYAILIGSLFSILIFKNVIDLDRLSKYKLLILITGVVIILVSILQKQGTRSLF